MKRIILPIFFCILTFGTWASEVVLQNGEDGVLYYILLPLPQDGRSDLHTDTPGALDYIKKMADTLDYIPPHGAVPFVSPEGPFLLLGFFVSPDQEKLPLVSLKIPAVKERTAFTVTRDHIRYGVDKKPEGFLVWEISYRTHAIQVDNRYLDWLKVPDLAKFSSAFSPGLFSRESGGLRETLKISESLFWKKGGTGVDTLKVLLEGNRLFIMISGNGEMTEGLSYFFYIFDDRSGGGSPKLTVEIPLQRLSGPVFLWDPEYDSPLYIGSYVRGAFLLEARIDLFRIPAKIREHNWTDLSADFTSCFFNAGHTEEFYFTTFSEIDVPRR
jgi:hypothetical protein